MSQLSRLEVFVKQKGFFSEMQFGFQEGINCIAASILYDFRNNHMLERGCKIFSCFLDVRKAVDTVWIDIWTVIQVIHRAWGWRQNVVNHRRPIH